MLLTLVLFSGLYYDYTKNVRDEESKKSVTNFFILVLFVSFIIFVLEFYAMYKSLKHIFKNDIFNILVTFFFPLVYIVFYHSETPHLDEVETKSVCVEEFEEV